MAEFSAEKLTIKELTAKYRTGSLSPVAITKIELAKLKSIDPRVNPIVYRFDEQDILRQAQESEARYQSGEPLGAFDGVPVTFKDDAVIKDYRCTFGSFFLKTGAFEFMGYGGDAPTESEKCVKMLQDSGAIPLCVSTCPECCCTEGCATFVNGVTRNPHHLMKSPGGSSGGAGALTACNIGYINMGSDMGGSIRIPAANNGCFGIKPSYSIGKCADIAMFPYFGCNGPLAARMEDIILYYQELQNYTKLLPESVDLSDQNLMDVDSIRNLRIAVSKDLDGTVDYVDRDVWKGVLKVASELKKLGATVEFVEPPLHSKHGLLTMKANEIAVELISVEYAKYAKLVRGYKGGRYEKLVVPFLMKLCDKGGTVTAEDVTNAMAQCDLLRHVMHDFVGNKYDLLLMPSTPIPPRDSIGYHEEGYIIDRVDGKRKSLAECGHAPTCFTTLANVSQQPAIVVPTGSVPDKDHPELGRLPISAMFVGPLNRDDLCLKVAYALRNKFKFIPAKL